MLERDKPDVPEDKSQLERPCLKISLCGSLHVELDRDPVTAILNYYFRGALLAFLVLRPGPQPNGYVLNQLWPAESNADRDKTKARDQDLSRTVSNLNRVVNDTRDVLGPWRSILITANGYVTLNPTGIDVDVLELKKAWDQREVDNEGLRIALERCSRPLLEPWKRPPRRLSQK
jgi:DNA-binding SARP family transcriptional activator